MLNKIRNLLSSAPAKAPVSLTELRNKYFHNLTSSPIHSWIAENKYNKRAFKILIDSLSEDLLKFFFIEHQVVFVRANGTLSCTLSGLSNKAIVVVFPDLVLMLRSGSPIRGVSTLAHELGHIFHRHSERKISPIEAQLEADHFACSLGFGNELQDVLLDYKNSQECLTRINHLTSLLK